MRRSNLRPPISSGASRYSLATRLPCSKLGSAWATCAAVCTEGRGWGVGTEDPGSGEAKVWGYPKPIHGWEPASCPRCSQPAHTRPHLHQADAAPHAAVVELQDEGGAPAAAEGAAAAATAAAAAAAAAPASRQLSLESFPLLWQQEGARGEVELIWEERPAGGRQAGGGWPARQGGCRGCQMAARALQRRQRLPRLRPCRRSPAAHRMWARLRASPFLRAISSMPGKWLSFWGRARRTSRSVPALVSHQNTCAASSSASAQPSCFCTTRTAGVAGSRRAQGSSRRSGAGLVPRRCTLGEPAGHVAQAAQLTHGVAAGGQIDAQRKRGAGCLGDVWASALAIS